MFLFKSYSMKNSWLMIGRCLIAVTFVVTVQARARNIQQEQAASSGSSHARSTESASPATEDGPPYREYKGVRLGMSAEEARKKLGHLGQKSDVQDFYLFSEKESAQIFYDATKTVSAIAIIYSGAESNAPTVKDVLGTDVEAQADGSIYKMERYPKAGFWVSYSRVTGETPMVTVTMKKLRP